MKVFLSQKLSVRSCSMCHIPDTRRILADVSPEKWEDLRTRLEFSVFRKKIKNQKRSYAQISMA